MSEIESYLKTVENLEHYKTDLKTSKLCMGGGAVFGSINSFWISYSVLNYLSYNNFRALTLAIAWGIYSIPICLYLGLSGYKLYKKTKTGLKKFLASNKQDLEKLGKLLSQKEGDLEKLAAE